MGELSKRLVPPYPASGQRGVYKSLSGKGEPGCQTVLLRGRFFGMEIAWRERVRERLDSFW